MFPVTDAACAFIYLENLTFDTVIIDIARQGNPLGGMIRQWRREGFGKPIVCTKVRVEEWGPRAGPRQLTRNVSSSARLDSSWRW